jgi:hypothetical protein
MRAPRTLNRAVVGCSDIVPTRVAGLADALTVPYAAPGTDAACVRFARGAHAAVLAGADLPRGFRPTAGPGDPAGDTSIELSGAEGALLTDPWSDAPVQVLGPGAGTLEPVTCQRPSNAHGPVIDGFARSILGDRPPRDAVAEARWNHSGRLPSSTPSQSRHGALGSSPCRPRSGERRLEEAPLRFACVLPRIGFPTHA